MIKKIIAKKTAKAVAKHTVKREVKLVAGTVLVLLARKAFRKAAESHPRLNFFKKLA